MYLLLKYTVTGKTVMAKGWFDFSSYAGCWYRQIRYINYFHILGKKGPCQLLSVYCIMFGSFQYTICVRNFCGSIELFVIFYTSSEDTRLQMALKAKLKVWLFRIQISSRVNTAKISCIIYLIAIITYRSLDKRTYRRCNTVSLHWKLSHLLETRRACRLWRRGFRWWICIGRIRRCPDQPLQFAVRHHLPPAATQKSLSYELKRCCVGQFDLSKYPTKSFYPSLPLASHISTRI